MIVDVEMLFYFLSQKHATIYLGANCSAPSVVT